MFEMNENNFFFTIDKIDEKFIAEAIESAMEENGVEPIFVQPATKRKSPLFAVGLAAACFALVFGLGIAVKTGMEQGTTQPPLNTADTTSETEAADIIQKEEEEEPQGVEMTDENGIEFTLFGEPVDQGELKDFSYDPAYRRRLEILNNKADFLEFTDSLPISDEEKEEFKNIYIRGYTLALLAKYGNDKAVCLTDNNGTEIRLKEHGGIPYRETGASYDSFLKAYDDVFTEETAENIIERSGAWCDVHYNNELWCYEPAIGGDPNIIYSDYELVGVTDDEIEFNEVYYYSDLSAYYPWWKDLYTSFKMKNVFKKTENGWRVQQMSFGSGCTTVGFERESFDYVEKDKSLVTDALSKIYYNNVTLSPLQDPWTEEKVAEAYGESSVPYTVRYFCDIDKDGVPELILDGHAFGKNNEVRNGVTVYSLDDRGEVIYRGYLHFTSFCYNSFGYFIYTDDISAMKEEIKPFNEYGIDFITDGKFCILTDSNGKFYLPRKCWGGEYGVKYQICEITFSELDEYDGFKVVPLYEWGTDFRWFYEDTGLYRKCDEYEGFSNCSKEEIWELLDGLVAAE